jgi:hypothetical protein
MKIQGSVAALVLAVVSVGCDDANPLVPAPNGEPSVAFVGTVPPVAIVGITSVRFQAAGTDPNGDPLTYTWHFGDGATATGSSVAHVFATIGTFPVTVVVDDGKGGLAKASHAITVGSISGYWTSRARQWKYEIRQDGDRITGRIIGFKYVVYPAVPVLWEILKMHGTVTAPYEVEFSAAWDLLYFRGAVEGSLDSIKGTLVDCCQTYGDEMVRTLATSDFDWQD